MLQGLGLRFGRREGSYQGLHGSSAVKVFLEFGPLLLLHSWGFGRREVAAGFRLWLHGSCGEAPNRGVLLPARTSQPQAELIMPEARNPKTTSSP